MCILRSHARTCTYVHYTPTVKKILFAIRKYLLSLSCAEFCLARRHTTNFCGGHKFLWWPQIFVVATDFCGGHRFLWCHTFLWCSPPPATTSSNRVSPQSPKVQSAGAKVRMCSSTKFAIGTSLKHEVRMCLSTHALLYESTSHIALLCGDTKSKFAKVRKC